MAEGREVKFFTEANCEVCLGKNSCHEHAISLDKANRLLGERGQVGFGGVYSNGAMDISLYQTDSDTHKCLIICVEEIEKDKPLTREQCDAISINGFNAEQIETMAHYYIMNTGVDLRIEKDTPEKVLKDLVRFYSGVTQEKSFAFELAERARKLIAKGGEVTNLADAEKEITHLRKENARLKLTLAYLPKVPTEPYEKEMAKEILSLRARNEKLVAALKDLVDDWNVVTANNTRELEGEELLNRQKLHANATEALKENE